MFKINNAANMNGTSFHDTTVNAIPSTLIERLGEPREGSSDGKVQLTWSFSDDDGNVFTLYDWKEYDINVKESTTSIEFHVGSRTPDLEYDFEKWLKSQISLGVIA